MASAILIFILLIVVFALLYKGTHVVLGSALGKTVRARHKAAEEILNTGNVPAEWRRDYDKRRRKHAGSGSGPEDAPDSNVLWRLHAQAKKQALKRMDDLLKYFARAPVFDSEDTRKELIQELRDVQARWKESDWAEMTDDDTPD